jgi:hypothetical protein
MTDERIQWIPTGMRSSDRMEDVLECTIKEEYRGWHTSAGCKQSGPAAQCYARLPCILWSWGSTEVASVKKIRAKTLTRVKLTTWLLFTASGTVSAREAHTFVCHYRVMNSFALGSSPQT